MQETRQFILDILKEHGQATVDDIVSALRDRRGDKITAVTVRHHLNELQKRELIATPHLRHRSTPGRPQHIYVLTDKAREYFPNNYQRLAEGLLEQIQAQLPADGVNVILEGVADGMAQEANTRNLPFDKRMERVVAYLNDHGYEASFETADEGFILHTHNCPYHNLTHRTDALCGMDMRLISGMLGVVPRVISRVSEGDATCAYLVPTPTAAE